MSQSQRPTRLGIASLALLIGIASATSASAQSTAAPVQPGSLTTSGCPSGFTSCFLPYSITNPLPISPGSGAGAGTPTDRGGTITVGGTAQTAIALNASRKNAVVENPVSATEDLYVSITGSATVNSSGNVADLAPGGSVFILGTAAVSVNAATATHRFIATEWQ